ncbi:hypothetical protein H9Q08_03065 [Chryseobacterium sp. PS-8]|uniref:Uncharacterized protein n=1 Tax=Chryseobacterium indicum TaxID=2766954 RepID=A0ABS9C1U0_9FLAO|nr:hypothetical protein [Chryseobacterium sp. PS-8]MCF2218280.1 hypothetical protein [Chryseobacterium sp. PS-8]
MSIFEGEVIFNEKNLKIGDEVDAGSMKLRSAKDVEMMKLIHEEGSGVNAERSGRGNRK